MEELAVLLVYCHLCKQRLWHLCNFPKISLSVREEIVGEHHTVSEIEITFMIISPPQIYIKLVPFFLSF